MSGVFRGIVDRFLGIVETLNGLNGQITVVAGSGIYITISGNEIIISTTPSVASAAVFFFQNDNNAYAADLYGTTYLSNFNLVT